MKKNEQAAPAPGAYRVTVYGKDVEFTKSLRDAEVAFKESTGEVKLWDIAPSGIASLLKQKV